MYNHLSMNSINKKTKSQVELYFVEEESERKYNK